MKFGIEQQASRRAPSSPFLLPSTSLTTRPWEVRGFPMDECRALPTHRVAHVLLQLLKVESARRAQHGVELVGAERGVVTQGKLVGAYHQLQLRREVIAPPSCAAAVAANTGREIHDRIYYVEGGGARSHFVSNALVNMYCKCGELERARRVFGAISLPNSVSWCSIISGCCQCGEETEALRIFSRARRVGAEEVVTHFVLASVLGACATLEELGFGEQLHCHVIKCGLGSDKYIEVGMVHLYAKCGEVDRANRVFSELEALSLASWMALLGGYVQLGQGQKVMALFSEMRASDLAPNEHTLSTTVLACSYASASEAERQLHSLLLKSGYRLVGHVANALVDGYAKCGLLEESSKVFGEMEERDAISWNSLIAGYARQHEFDGFAEALKRMQLGDVHPNLHTYSHILSFYGDLPSVAWGKQTHARVIKSGFDGDVVVGSSIVDMYAKCGRLEDSRKVFCKLTVKNLVSWNSMVAAYAQHGLGKEAADSYQHKLIQSTVLLVNCWVLNTNGSIHHVP